MSGVASAGGPVDAAEQRSAVTEAPTEASAIAAARSSGQRVEVLDKRSESAQVFANPSGTLTLEQSAEPVRVRRGDDWVPVDTTLAWQPDGSVAPAASAVGLRLSGGGDGPAITITRDGQELSLTWPDRLPAPELSGDIATYPEVLAGVDLRLRATPTGFTQLVVVKNRAAAAGLDRVRFRVTTVGVSLRPGDGGLVAADPSGRSVFVPATAMMWDSPRAPVTPAQRQGWDLAGPPPGRQLVIPVALSGDELAVTPDRAMLADSATNYPVSIDPSYFWNAFVWQWLHLNLFSPNQPGWGFDQNDGGAKVGYSNWESPTVRYRSFFQFDVGGLYGKEIINSWFSITMNHSAACSDTPVDLWLTGAIDTGTTWGNTGDGWWQWYLDTRSGHAHDLPSACGVEPDLSMEFGRNAAMRDAVRSRTDASRPVTLGLKAPNEGERLQWKKFWPATARLHIEYNSFPNPPSSLSADINLPCVVGAGRPVTNTNPTLWATGSDADGGNVEVEFEWWFDDGARIGSYRQPFLASGSRFSAQVLSSQLQDGKVYSWRARAGDGRVWGGWSAWCDVAFDTTKPTATPAVSSTAFPEDDVGAPVGVRGEFTFTSDDADVYGYRFGLTESTTYFVAAGSGTGRPATAPVTMWTSSPRSLFVYSVDQAGNRSDSPRIYRFKAASSSSTPPRVRGDVHGDGVADLVGVVQRDPDETAFVTLGSTGGGQFYQPVRTWESGPNTNFHADWLQSVKGDFNGDGRSDMAVFRKDGAARVTLWLFYGNGTGFDVPTAPAWDSGAGNWDLARVKLGVGDINGDGKDDLVHLYNYDNATFRLWTFVSTATGVQPPAVWWSNPAGAADWHRMKLVIGDFTGDGRADFGHFYNYDGDQTRLWVHSSTGTAFTAATVWWDSGAGNWAWARTNPVVADFNRDGKSDLGALYDYGGARTKLWLFSSTGAAVACCTLVWDSGGPGTWNAANTKLAAGDVTGDGRADVIAANYTAKQRTIVWTFDGNASGGLNSPVNRWDSGDWGLDWTRTSFY